MLKKGWCALALIALAVPGQAPAQQRLMVDLDAYGGLYLPATDLIQFSDVIAQGGGFSEATAEAKTAVAFGGRVSLWLADAFGVEGGFAYALSDGDIKGDGQSLCGQLVGGDLVECDANVWSASLKALYRFAPTPGGRVAILLGGGPALIGHTGTAFEDLEGTTDIGGVADIGLLVDVTPMVGLRLDGEGYLYSAKFKDTDGTELGDAQFQADLIFSGGVFIKLGR